MLTLKRVWLAQRKTKDTLSQHVLDIIYQRCACTFLCNDTFNWDAPILYMEDNSHVNIGRQHGH